MKLCHACRWVLGLVLAGGVGRLEAAVVVRGSVKLPEELHAQERPQSFWPRQENGVLRIAPPLVAPLADVVVVLQGTAPPPASVGAVTVDVAGAGFVPRTVAVGVGTTIEFRNLDRIAYSLFSPDNASFFAKEETGGGKTRKIRFLAPGIYPVRTVEFPHMQGSILVWGSSLYAKPDEKGSFRIENVPDGAYTLKVFWRDRFIHEEAIEVLGRPQEVVVKIAAPAAAPKAAER